MPTTARLFCRLPKSRPDFESAGACWCSAEDLLEGGLRLRGGEPRHWARLVEQTLILILGTQFMLHTYDEGIWREVARYFRWKCSKKGTVEASLHE